MDACLTAHVDSAARAAYLPQLRESGITIVRERGPNPEMAELQAAGLRVVSFLGLGPLPKPQPGDALPEDLLAVFAAAKAMQETYGRNVDVWEMVNEPDVGYCRDLPDRLAAFQKAVYLGIKAGAAADADEKWRMEEQRGAAKSSLFDLRSSVAPAALPRAPLVLMGAVALPPGPWLERAARNGLLDYTDAYNLHFYGYAGDLAGVIRAHEAFARKWVDLRSRDIVVRRAGGSGTSGMGILPMSDGLTQTHGQDARATLTQTHGQDARATMDIHPSAFPIWITECGLNAIVPGDFLNPARRQLQADFTVATARQAKASENVAVFMPFILVGKNIPEALTLAPDRPLPAWNAYADYARSHPFPARVIAMPPRDPNPVVVQWLPDNRTAIPHKVSGCYRFWLDQPMHGVLRIYNFGAVSVQGRLEAEALRHVSLECRDLHLIASTTGGASGMGILPVSDRLTQTHGQDARATKAIQIPHESRSSVLTIPALGRLELPVTFTPTAVGYFRDFFEASFLDEHGRRSPVYFGLEAMPDEDDLLAVPLPLVQANPGKVDHPDLDGDAVTSQSGAWTGINGVIVDEGIPDRFPNRNEAIECRPGSPHPASRGDPAGFGDPALHSPAETATAVARPLTLKVSATKLNRDPLFPAMAIARISGLPLHGFLRLQLDHPMDADFRVRVDLIDRQEQRFTIWENFGASYFGPRDDIWLNLEDFHIYFWGRCSDHPIFRPQDVEGIRLRLYFARTNDPRLIRLSLLQVQSGPEAGIPR